MPDTPVLTAQESRKLVSDRQCLHCDGELQTLFNAYAAYSRYCPTCDAYWELMYGESHSFSVFVYRKGRGMAAWVGEPAQERAQRNAARGDPHEYHRRPFPTCPYCGYEDHDWPFGTDDGRGGLIAGQCTGCRKIYIVTRHVTTTYSTRPEESEAL